MQLPSLPSFSLPSASSISKSTLITILVSSLATSSVLLTFQAFQKRRRVKHIKRQLKGVDLSDINIDDVEEGMKLSSSLSGLNQVGFDEELLREQLSRNISFLGEEGVEKLKKSFVIVVGCGGVGSHAAHLLLRSGVQHIRLIDFDQVTLSSLNRHAVATHADVGTPKVRCLQKYFKAIMSSAKVEGVVEMFTGEMAKELLAGNPDFVLDCIDNIDTKLDLIKYCHENNIPIISSMGAGAKADPSRIQIADISETQEDPLARATRRKLKKMGITSGVPVVYSTEKPGSVGLLPLQDYQLNNPHDFAQLPEFRVRVLPVLGTIPALFGLSLATYVIARISNFHIEPLPIKNRITSYEKLHRELSNKERDVFKSTEPPYIAVSEVGYLVEEVWRGRSAISQSFDKLALTRWNTAVPSTLQNTIVMTRSEALKHEKAMPKTRQELLNIYGEEVVAYVERRYQIEKEWSQWR